MSEVSGQVIIPYVGVERVAEVLSVIYKTKSREITVNELSKLLGCGVSSINNVTPTLGALGLVKVEKRVITLTDDGLEFISAYLNGKTEISKRIVRAHVDGNESLKFVKSLLETRVQLSGEDIGRSLSDRFSKNWKHLGTIRTFGNSCASIISFAGLGYYSDGILGLKPFTTKSETGFYPPEAGYTPILSLLSALHPYDRAKSSDLAVKLHAKESQIARQLAVSVILGLAEKNVSGGYSIAEAGRKLIDPRLAAEEKSKIFLDCLLHSPYSDIITRLSQTSEELSHESLGDILAYELRRDWTSASKEIYGKKFTTWLFGADVIERVGPNKFKIKASIGNVIVAEKPAIDSKQLKEVYEIGRTLGGLETIMPLEENKKEFDDRVSMLGSMLKEHGDLDLVLELLKKNFDLSIQSKNIMIYRSNIEFIRDKITQKLGVLG